MADLQSNVKLSPVWNEALWLWARVFKRSWAWLLFAMTIDELSSLGAAALTRFNETFMITGALFTVGVQLLLSAFGVIIINQIVVDVRDGVKSNILKSLRENLKFVLIETTRAILPVLLRLCLFVVPGIVEMARLFFIPYVVQFNIHYKSGQIDALEESRRLVRGRFWRVCGIIVLSTAFSMLPQAWLGAIPIFVRPVAFVMVFFVCMVCELYSDIVMFCAFERLQASLKAN